jgi:nucleoside-diphosphate-sugar epimerase
MFEPDLSGRSVLLTGAAGFIGSHLLRRLLAAGATVHATSREVRPIGEPALHWHQIDLTNEAAVDEMVRLTKPHLIFHLASHVAGARDLALVLPTFHANLASTLYLLTAAAKVGCERLVLTGSLEEPEDQTPPASPYAAAKAAAASYARMFHLLYGTPVVLARLFMVYGPAQRDVRKLVPYVILSLLQGGEVKLSSGVRPVDWVYVDDVVEGLLRLAVTEGVEGRRIDLGSGRLVTVREVVEKLYGLLAPGAELELGGLPDRPHEQVRAADVEATEDLLGWRPRVGLEKGLRATVDYYRRQHEAGRRR